MTTPISNNNPGGIANNKSARPEARDANGRGSVPVAADEGQVADRQADAVTVSRAAEMLSQGVAAQRGRGVIQSPEQAAQLAQQLKPRIQADPAGALAAQAQGLSGSIMALLEAG